MPQIWPNVNIFLPNQTQAIPSTRLCTSQSSLQNSSLLAVVPTLITSLSTRWFSLTGARLLHSAGRFARGNWLVYTHLLLLSSIEQSRGLSSTGTSLCWGSWANGLAVRKQLPRRSATSKETIRNTLFLLLPTINHHCVELVAAYRISGF